MGSGKSDLGERTPGIAGGTYRGFDDEQVPGEAFYSGWGKNTERFFEKNSNNKEIENKMSTEEMNAFYEWTDGFFMNGQQYRGDFWENEYFNHEQELTRIYDKILDKSVINESIVVARKSTPELLGLPQGAIKTKADLKKLEDLNGRQILCRGNMSFAAAKEGLDIGGTAAHVEYRLHIQGGTKGAGMYIGTDNLSTWGNNQREFMTNRDIVVTARGARWDDRRNIAVVDLYYVGREKKHSY